MSATIQGSMESCVVAETSNGSACTDQEIDLKNVETAVVSEKPTEVATMSTGQLTDNQLLDLSEDSTG